MAWPKQRARAEALRLERHAAQSWRPACYRCGERAKRKLRAVNAEAWWREHRCPTTTEEAP